MEIIHLWLSTHVYNKDMYICHDISHCKTAAFFSIFFYYRSKMCNCSGKSNNTAGKRNCAEMAFPILKCGGREGKEGSTGPFAFANLERPWMQKDMLVTAHISRALCIVLRSTLPPYCAAPSIFLNIYILHVQFFPLSPLCSFTADGKL